MPSTDSPDVDTVVAQAAALFDTQDSVSRVISNLDLPVDDLPDKYDSEERADFDFEAMVRLFLYKEVGEFSQSQIADRVSDWPYLQQRFGLDGPVDQQIISYTKRNRFSLSVRRFIAETSEGIRAAAEEQGIRSKEVESPDSDPDPDEIVESPEPVHHYVDQHAPSIISTALDQVCPAFDTGRRYNSKHADERVWEHQLAMSLADRSGTRSAYRTFNKFRGDALHHDTHTRALKKLGTPTGYQYTFDDYPGTGRPIPHWRRITDTIQSQFNDAIERMVDLVRPADVFSEPVVAAIDITKVPYHVSPWKGEDEIERGDERIVVDETSGRTKVPKSEYPELVSGGKNDREYAYKYATLTIVGRNAPLVLAVEPVRENSQWEGDAGETVALAETVDRLMEQATELVDIHLVMADREFDQHGVFHVLDQYHDVNYLVPKKTNSIALREEVEEVRTDPTVTSRVEADAPLHLRKQTRYIDAEEDPTVGEDGYSHDVSFMYVPADSEDWVVTEENDVEYAVFVTNRDDVTPMDAIGFTDRYSDRWDIENEYKMIKPLLPSIASKDYRMRFFSFVFSCLLYNLWRVVDHSLKVLVSERYDEYGRGRHEKRLATLLPLSDYLLSSIVLLFGESGFDPPD